MTPRHLVSSPTIHSRLAWTMLFAALLVLCASIASAQTLPKNVQVNATTNALTTPTASQFSSANSFALTTGNLSQFATTSSAQLAGVISDETGSGALVFGTSPTFTTPNLGAATATSLTLGGAAGAGFISFPVQSSAPATPAAGFVEFSDATGQRAWRRASDGFVRSWASTLTANRTWTWPDATGDVAVVSAAGLPARTGSATWAARTITGTTGQITVTNGDGVAGNPTIALPSTISQATTLSANVASTSTSSGTLIISGSGGIGLGGALYSGGDIQAGGTNAQIRAVNSNSEFGSVLAGGTVAGGQWTRIGASRVLNYGDSLISRNLRPVSGADTYQTSATAGYAGMEFFFDGSNSYGARWIVSNAAQTANTPFTPSYAMTLSSAGVLTLSSSTSGLGFSTGAGGTVTQTTNRTTGVTLNRPTGAITLVSAAGSTSWQSFTVTNSVVAATDTIIVNQVSGTDLMQMHVTAVSAGSFRITFATTGGTTTEQPVIRFTVIKSVSS